MINLTNLEDKISRVCVSELDKRARLNGIWTQILGSIPAGHACLIPLSAREHWTMSVDWSSCPSALEVRAKEGCNCGEGGVPRHPPVLGYIWNLKFRYARLGAFRFKIKMLKFLSCHRRESNLGPVQEVIQV